MSKFTIDPDIAGNLDVKHRLLDLAFEIADAHGDNMNKAIGAVLGTVLSIMTACTGSLRETRRLVILALDVLEEKENVTKTGLKNLH